MTEQFLQVLGAFLFVVLLFFVFFSGFISDRICSVDFLDFCLLLLLIVVHGIVMEHKYGNGHCDSDTPIPVRTHKLCNVGVVYDLDG